ncbi:MAG: hypothetical protein A2X12_02120 [Bacteroidetes bacterium GWE2_29_8]|nr:MAG: hypothetical protein A2X12_02120 [Bacteroidetes bacterium GWE2_29_8]
MLKKIISILLITLIFNNIYCQEGNYSVAKKELDKRGEVYLKIKLDDKEKINELSKIVSISNIKNDTVFFFANKKGFEKLGKYLNDYIVIPYDKSNPTETKLKKKENLDFGSYPSYSQYVQFMYSLQDKFPNLCKVYEIGQSVNGKKLLFLKISDNVSKHEAEPELMYSAAIHGNEPGSYVLMLRLSDYLLSNYQSDNFIRTLIDNTQIWINPLANPDGMYALSDNSIYGGTRFNANGVDINRNFPDYVLGNNPDGEEQQKETKEFISFFKQHNFILSANFHSGTEVLNYPYDCLAELHADNNYFVNICRKYADTAHVYSNNTYMTAYNNGITNGYAWYSVYGGRQDYLNIFCNTKEVTIEVDNAFITPESDLDQLWLHNYHSLINYFAEALYGANGLITDSLTNKPLHAKFFIKNRDNEVLNSFIYSDSSSGYYHKLIEEGQYQATISKDGYLSKDVEFIVTDNDLLNQNIQLIPLNTGNVCFNIIDSINDNPLNYKIMLYQDDVVFKTYTNDSNPNYCIQLTEGNYNVIIEIDSINKYYLNLNCYKDSTVNIERKLLGEGKQKITENNNTLSIYPNPFYNHINLTFDEYLQKNKVSLEIKSITGSLLYNKTIDNFDAQPIDLSFLKQGIYILNISGASFFVTKKIIKIQ